MELNGIANIKMMVDLAVHENTESHTSITVELADKISEQLDLLERYMLVIEERRVRGQAIPAWHEIRENKKCYPTRRQIIKGKK